MAFDLPSVDLPILNASRMSVCRSRVPVVLQLLPVVKSTRSISVILAVQRSWKGSSVLSRREVKRNRSERKQIASGWVYRAERGMLEKGDAEHKSKQGNTRKKHRLCQIRVSDQEERQTCQIPLTWSKRTSPDNEGRIVGLTSL